MNTMQVTCGNCAGIGKKSIWIEVSKDEDTGIGTLHRKEFVCETCKGKGYIEYAVFSVEEAKTILKHCGLSTES
jgi:hypothetical protein